MPPPPSGPRGNEGDGCENQNTIWDWTVFGAPTAGTVSATVIVNGVSEVLAFAWNLNATDFKAVMATHPEIADTDMLVTGGPWPNATIRTEFIDTLANTLILPPTAAWGSLSGGTGRGVIINMSQRGH